jgi:hypothetical protein
MTLATYDDLQDEVINGWLDREGDDDAVARFPTWLALCEARIRRQQEWFRQIYSLANSGDPLSITAYPMELPNFVREVTTMWNATDDAHGEIEIVTPSAWRGFTSLNSSTGNARANKAVIVPQMDSFLVDPDGVGVETLHGAYLYLHPRVVIDGSYKVDFEYIRDLPPLTANVTNGLFIRHPDLYLYGTLVETAPYYEHDERLPLWEQRFTQAIAEINRERERAQFSASRKRIQLPRSF